MLFCQFGGPRRRPRRGEPGDPPGTPPSESGPPLENPPDLPPDGPPEGDNSKCRHLTLAATRPLKVLYFDGSSGAKMKDGEMDTQDIVAWGKVSSDRFFDERNRINDLCEWGKKYQLDGFVR
jgi:hypothetical protein